MYTGSCKTPPITNSIMLVLFFDMAHLGKYITCVYSQVGSQITAGIESLVTNYTPVRAFPGMCKAMSCQTLALAERFATRFTFVFLFVSYVIFVFLVSSVTFSVHHVTCHVRPVVFLITLAFHVSHVIFCVIYFNFLASHVTFFFFSSYFSFICHP